jgi:hypothetical protein
VHLQPEQAISTPAPASFSQSIALNQNVHNMEQAMQQTTTTIGTLQQLVGKQILDKDSLLTSSLLSQPVFVIVKQLEQQ